MRLPYPLRCAAVALAALTLAACGGGDADHASDTAVPAAGATGTAGTMPADTAAAGTMTGTGTTTGTATGTTTGTATPTGRP